MEQEQRPTAASAPWTPLDDEDDRSSASPTPSLQAAVERRQASRRAVAGRRHEDRGDAQVIAAIRPAPADRSDDDGDDLSSELARMRRVAEDALRQRSELLALLAVASHDLRTPINAIAGYGDLLLMELQGPLTAEQRASVERIRLSAQQLVALVADTMSFAHHEAGRLECRVERVDVRAALAEAASLVQLQFASKNVLYEARIAPGLAALADRERVLQILRAILGTCAARTPRGGRVTVEAGLAPLPHRPVSVQRVRLIVRHDGDALTPDALARLFDAYGQIAARHARLPGSVGLGLALGRELARAMGGELVAESPGGRECIFELSLPSGERGSTDA